MNTVVERKSSMDQVAKLKLDDQEYELPVVVGSEEKVVPVGGVHVGQLCRSLPAVGGGRMNVRVALEPAPGDIVAEDGHRLWASNHLCGEIALCRDFPDGLWPTTAVGLSDEYIADREINKHFFCSAEGAKEDPRSSL